MATDPQARMRCRRCGMPRLGDSRTCAACEADLTVAGALEPVGRVGAGQGRVGSSGTRQARRQEEVPAPRPTRPPPTAPVTPPTAPVMPSPPAPVATAPMAPVTPAPATAAPSVGRRAPKAPVTPEPGPGAVAATPRLGRLWLAMDDQSRRTMVRLAVEIALLVVVVGLVAMNALGRSRPSGTASPTPSSPGIVAADTGLGIAAQDVTAVFELPQAGGFVFQAAVAGTEARLEGRAADGRATLMLAGPRTDLARAVLGIQVQPGSGDEAAARQLATLLLVLYCPGAMDQLLATLDEALAGGVDVSTSASADGVEVRLETRLQSSGGVTLTLLPVTTSTPATAAPSRPPSAAPSIRSTPRPS